MKLLVSHILFNLYYNASRSYTIFDYQQENIILSNSTIQVLMRLQCKFIPLHYSSSPQSVVNVLSYSICNTLTVPAMNNPILCCLSKIFIIIRIVEYVHCGINNNFN